MRNPAGNLTRPALSDDAAPHFARRAVHSTHVQPGDAGLPGSVDVPALPDHYDRAASDYLTRDRLGALGRPDTSELFPSLGASDRAALPDIGLNGVGRRAGVQDFGFHPIGGFGSNGIHVGAGPGGFSGFHPIGGFGSSGMHVAPGLAAFPASIRSAAEWPLAVIWAASAIAERPTPSENAAPRPLVA